MPHQHVACRSALTWFRVLAAHDLANPPPLRRRSPPDWALDYEASGLPPETRLDSLTLLVMRQESGDCLLGMTNGLAAGRAWASNHGAPIAPCGPFATPP